MISHMLFFPIWYVLKHSNVGKHICYLALIISDQSDHVALFAPAWLSSICSPSTPTAFRHTYIFISVCPDCTPYPVVGLTSALAEIRGSKYYICIRTLVSTHPSL